MQPARATEVQARWAGWGRSPRRQNGQDKRAWTRNGYGLEISQTQRITRRPRGVSASVRWSVLRPPSNPTDSRAAVFSIKPEGAQASGPCSRLCLGALDCFARAHWDQACPDPEGAGQASADTTPGEAEGSIFVSSRNKPRIVLTN